MQVSSLHSVPKHQASVKSLAALPIYALSLNIISMNTNKIRSDKIIADFNHYHLYCHSFIMDHTNNLC
jgi:hypothetical protein